MVDGLDVSMVSVELDDDGNAYYHYAGVLRVLDDTALETAITSIRALDGLLSDVVFIEIGKNEKRQHVYWVMYETR